VRDDLTSMLRMLTFLMAARRTMGLHAGTTIELTPFLAAWGEIDWGSDFLPELLVPEGFDRLFEHNEFKTERRTALAAAESPFASQRGGKTAQGQDAEAARESGH